MKRRSFLKITSGFALSMQSIAGSVLGANERIRLAVIGVGIRGRELAWQVEKMSGVEIVALCDPDAERVEGLAGRLGRGRKHRSAPRSETDFRKILDDPEIDGVLICSPNHWHAHMTVMACQAGKDVMVEKPVCHTLWEGWRMLEAAEKSGCIVSGGFQARGDSGMLDFMDWLKEENQPLGDLISVHAFWYNAREAIGKRKEPLPAPDSVDYDLWLGPARDEPIYRDAFHYDWHWVWNTGNGEIGNIGAHNLDLARWVCGDPMPSEVRTLSAGNRFVWDDAGETPNMHWAVIDFGTGVPVVVEVRSLPFQPGSKRGNGFKGMGAGIVASYEDGEFRGGRGGGKVYDTDNQVIRKFSGDGGRDHLASFFRAMRSRNGSELRCTLEDAVFSTQCCHLAEIGARLGEPLSPDELGEIVQARPPVLHELWDHMNRHLDNWEVDYAQQPWRVGPELVYDQQKQVFTSSRKQAMAQSMHQRDYRKAYPFPVS